MSVFNPVQSGARTNEDPQLRRHLASRTATLLPTPVSIRFWRTEPETLWSVFQERNARPVRVCDIDTECCTESVANQLKVLKMLERVRVYRLHVAHSK